MYAHERKHINVVQTRCILRRGLHTQDRLPIRQDNYTRSQGSVFSTTGVISLYVLDAYICICTHITRARILWTLCTVTFTCIRELSRLSASARCISVYTCISRDKQPCMYIYTMYMRGAPESTHQSLRPSFDLRLNNQNV